MAKHQARQTSQTVNVPRRGDIYLVDFDPPIGHEIQKTRPALIIQNDISNIYSLVTIIAAITSKFEDPPYPTEVILETAESGLPLRSAVLLNQIRSVDRQRLGKRLGHIDAQTMARVNRAILVCLGLTNL